MPPLTVFPIEGVPEIRAGDVLAELLVVAAQGQDMPFAPGDCVVVTQEGGSKAEGRGGAPWWTSGAGQTPTAGSSRSPRSHSPTRSPAPPSSSREGGAGAGGGRPRPRRGVVPGGVGAGARPPAGGGPVPLMAGGVPAFIEARRAIRAFLSDPLPPAELHPPLEGGGPPPGPPPFRPRRRGGGAPAPPQEGDG